VDQDNVIVANVRREDAPASHRPEPQRGLHRGVDRHYHSPAVRHHHLVQAFVIPTGSMEDTLLIGDHLLVDKLSYAPSGLGLQAHPALRGRSARRYHRFPLSVDIQQTFVKRAIGIPETTSAWSTSNSSSTARRSSSHTSITRPGTSTRIATTSPATQRARGRFRPRHASESRAEWRRGGAAGIRFRHGR